MDRAYKRLSKSDVIVTPFTANKQWNVLSSSLSSSNINVYKGVSGSLYDYTTTYDDQYQTLVYKSAEQLYYRNYTTYVSESNYSSSFFVNNGLIATQSLQSGQYWNYPQSTTGEIRYFPRCTGNGLLAGNWTVSKICHNLPSPPGIPICTSSFFAGDIYGEYVESNWIIDGSNVIVSQSNNTSLLPLPATLPISYPATNVVNLEGVVGGFLTPPDYEYFDITFSLDPLLNVYNSATLSLQPNSLSVSMSIYLDGIGTYPTNDNIWVVGIPRDLYGSKIKPGTFLMTSSYDYAVTEDGKGNLYLLDSSSLLTWDEWEDKWNIADYDWNSVPTASNFSLKRVGNIIYPHGMLIFTTHSLECELFLHHHYGDYDVKFKNEHIIYENVVKCTVRESEFNYTHNPSISTDTSGSLRDFATGSGFTPYVTTVGLYNDSQELLAVGKMAQPIPLSTNTDTTFLINYDT